MPDEAIRQVGGGAASITSITQISPWTTVVQALVPVIADQRASRLDRILAAEIILNTLKQKA